MHGGKSIFREISKNRVASSNDAEAKIGINKVDNFQVLLMKDPEKGGGGPGDVWQHQCQYTFGGVTYGEYDANINAYNKKDVELGGTNLHQLEKKVMFYTAAFFAKDFNGTGLGRSAISSNADQAENVKQTKNDSIENVSKANNLLIYPNPVKNSLNIVFETKQAGEIGIDIYNILGVKVYSNKRTNSQTGKIELDLSSECKNIAAGLYIIKVNTPSDTLTGEFLKEN